MPHFFYQFVSFVCFFPVLHVCAFLNCFVNFLCLLISCTILFVYFSFLALGLYKGGMKDDTCNTKLCPLRIIPGRPFWLIISPWAELSSSPQWCVYGDKCQSYFESLSLRRAENCCKLCFAIVQPSKVCHISKVKFQRSLFPKSTQNVWFEAKLRFWCWISLILLYWAEHFWENVCGLNI